MFRIHSIHTVGLLLSAFVTISSAFTVPGALSTNQRCNSDAAFLNNPPPLHYQETNLHSSEYLVQELEATHPSSQWENELARVGVVRIESALTPNLADACGYYIEDQKVMAWSAGTQGEEEAFADRVFYGPRKSESFCELQLSMLRSGYAGDFGKNVSDTERHVLADVLLEVVGPNGTLAPLFEHLVTSEGELYEMAAVVSDPGHHVEKEKIESLLTGDTRTADIPPLYTMYLAVHDVDVNMGPTTFFTNTHNENVDEQSLNGNAPPRRSIMKKGDAVIIDSRILFSYYANDSQLGSPFTMLKLSFRNPKYSGDLGYVGSLRPGYRETINLGDLGATLLAYQNGDGDSFKKVGDGMMKLDSNES